MAKKKKHKKYNKLTIPAGREKIRTGMRTESASLSSVLPKEFLEVISEILGDEYEAFLAGMEKTRHRGLRVNGLKISPEEFESRSPLHLTRIPWVKGGYYYDPEDNPSRLPDYAAGLYYLQEPSAMTPASRLPIKPGDRVLDLCAAPGGKATALGAALCGKGILLANDINRARARALLHNIELFGITNAIVCSEAPYRLAGRFSQYFDAVMVDAPCSGEGMFRKNPAVIEAWKEKGPEYFSGLQKEIVIHAADMLRPGGFMLYSTCTFSPLENEAVISHLLRARPEMGVVPMEDYEGFAPGLSSFRGDSYGESMTACRRIWPHRMDGEGHFLALLRKGDAEESGSGNRPGKSFGSGMEESGLSADEKNQFRMTGQRQVHFDYDWKTTPGADPDQIQSLTDFFGKVHLNHDGGHLRNWGGKLYLLPEAAPDVGGLECLRAGLCLGELKKKRFEPAQSLALALKKEQYDHILDIGNGDQGLRYLRGESLPVPAGTGESPESGGWRLVLADGYPLGFGKAVRGNLKNKYPAGWRWND